MEPIQIVAKITRWGKRSGGFFNASTGSYESKLPSHKGGSNNSRAKPKTDAALLVKQAMSYGYLNGKRIARKK